MINSLKIPEVYVPIIILILAVMAASFWAYSNSDTKPQTSADTSVSEGDFSAAKVIFPITEVSRSGSVVTLTITENARGLESESGIRMPVGKVLDASFQIDFDWDNDPTEGVRENDTTYGLKLGYGW